MDPVYIAVLKWFRARRNFLNQEDPILKDSDKKTIALIRPELLDNCIKAEHELATVALELEKNL